jgi:CRISPR-associated protein, csm2 family
MYNNKNFSNNTIQKRVVDINNENYVSKAEEVIRELVRIKGERNILTTSKIRKLLSMLTDIYRKSKDMKTDTLDSTILSKIQYFKLHFIYEAGREPQVKDFVEVAGIIEQIDKIGKDKKKLILFCHYMEALVAYRKYLVKNDK